MPAASSKAGIGRGWLLLVPFFALFAIFWVVPLFSGVYASLHADEVMGGGEFVGLQHYLDLRTDKRFFKALWNNAIYLLGVWLLILPLALGLAHLLRRVTGWLRPVLTFTLLIPGLTPPSVLAVLFLLVFHGKYGVLNQWVVMPLGFSPINWLKDPDWILPALILQAVWRWTGLMTFFLMAGLEGIPKVYLEVAHLFGARSWQVLRYVTLPFLKHILVFAAVYLLVDGLAMFTGAYMMLGGSGGTADAGLLFVSYTYYTSFGLGNFNAATAMGVAIMPLMLLALFILFWRPSQEEAVV